MDLINPYGSHQELLFACVARTKGPVIELGMGNYSTRQLHQMCVPYNRPLCSVETNGEWASQFDDLKCALHGIQIVSGMEDYRPIDTSWDVAFVDHHPAERRRVDVLRLAEKTRYIVIHDTDLESDGIYGIRATIASFKYRLDSKRWTPMTTVVSNIGPIDIF